MKKLYLVLFTIVASLALVACKDDATKENVELRMAINFDGNKFISYNKDNAYLGLDGKEYKNGDLLPVWSAIGENLNITFNDVGKTLGKANTAKQFDDAKIDGFTGIDIINSTGANITSERNNFVNLKPFIEAGKMPNLKKFLDSQPTYEPYLTASDGGMYYTPYLDGNEEVELGFLMRIDWTEKILDTTTAGDSTKAQGLENTTPFNPATLNKEIIVATENAGTRKVTINYSKNIITILKELGPDATGDQYLQAFRTYMEDVHGDDYDKLSDVFVGYDAGYLTAELVALMAVVKSNPQMLRGKADVSVYFPREAKGSRVRNFYRGLEMFGVRGAVSKNNWLYIDENGKLNDSRFEDSTIDAFNRLNSFYKDELIIQNFDNAGTNKNWRDELLKAADGFLMYDYNATQTPKSIIDEAVKVDPNYRFESILPPVNDWRGTGEYFHFTESVRMLKNEAWGITKQAATDETKLERAIMLFDYLYDEKEGANLHLYGPEAWRQGTITYQGKEIPAFHPKVLEEIQTLGKGNMTNYLREYVGATNPIGHIRSLGLELQTVSEQGLSGYNRVRNAVEAGVFRLLGLYDKNDKWYYPVPNVFPLTTAQENHLKEVKGAFDTYWGDNQLHIMIKEGLYDGRLEAYKAMFEYEGERWVEDYLKYHQEALPQ